MQGEQMLTGPIVNERKILIWWKGSRTIIYYHTVRRNTHKKIVLSVVVLMAEMGKNHGQSCMNQMDGRYQEHYLPASLSDLVNNQLGVSFDKDFVLLGYNDTVY